MKVSYKDYTGELVKLEKNIRPLPFGGPSYSLSIRMESGELVQFEDVELSKLRFCGGQVSFSE